MMETKAFEIRDRMTFIPVLATRLAPGYSISPTTGQPEWNEREDAIMKAAGYAPAGDWVLLVRLTDCRSSYDPFRWDGGRTVGEAHRHIMKNWNELRSGDVIDVEFVLGETSKPKEPQSQRRRA